MTVEGNNKNGKNFESIPAAGTLLNSAESIEAFGREYFAAEFPNPERVGCPPRASLTALARSMNAPDKEIQEHLFSCSSCFNEFRAAMSSPADVSAPWFERLLAPGMRLPALATLGLLAVSLAVGLFVIQQTRRQPTQTAAGNQENAAHAEIPLSANESGKISQSNAPPSATPEPRVSQRDLLAMVTVRVDLRQRTSLGSTEREAQAGANVEPVRLAAARTRLYLTLPEGSASGVYVISVLDRGSLKPVISARASTSNGKSVETILNLDRLEQEEYVLRVARAGESPSDFQLFIYRPRKKLS